MSESEMIGEATAVSIQKLQAEIERLWAENRRLLEELDEAESRAVVLERKEAEREKRLRMERFN
uniref:Uncharacterized protein n=1 Tax=viral metagenome TaxID=1070528 RepID=A0A6M3JHU3_9ZZZZ